MTIDRRTFVQTATVLAVAAAGTQAAQAQPSALSQATAAASAGATDPNALPDLSSLDPNAPPAPRPDGVAAPTMKRFDEQRWILDNIIRANGIDWDQPRLPGLAAALGPEASTDIAAIRTRVQKFADIAPAFESVARGGKRGRSKRRRARTRSARDNFFMAANFWGGARGDRREQRQEHLLQSEEARVLSQICEARGSPRRSAWILLDGKFLPGWFHLPYGYRAGGVPCVVSIPAWTATRAKRRALRGPLSVAGDRGSRRRRPGPIRECGAGRARQHPAWQAAGPAMFNCWRTVPKSTKENRYHRLELRIAVFDDRSVGRAALWRGGGEHLPRAGCHTIFQEASPTFKSASCTCREFQTRTRSTNSGRR